MPPKDGQNNVQAVSLVTCQESTIDSIFVLPEVQDKISGEN